MAQYMQGISYVDESCTSLALLSKTLFLIIIQWFLTFKSTILVHHPSTYKIPWYMYDAKLRIKL